MLFDDKTSIILTGGLDNFILVWTDKGSLKYKMNSDRLGDMQLFKNGKMLLILSATEFKICVIDIDKKSEVHQIKEKEQILCMQVSYTEKFLLTNCSQKSPEIHLWSLENFELLNKFSGFKQEKFLIRCGMGYEGDQIIAQGSEDGRIMFWNRNYNKPISEI